MKRMKYDCYVKGRIDMMQKYVCLLVGMVGHEIVMILASIDPLK